jgi:hypothetical protein
MIRETPSDASKEELLLALNAAQRVEAALKAENAALKARRAELEHWLVFDCSESRIPPSR